MDGKRQGGCILAPMDGATVGLLLMIAISGGAAVALGVGRGKLLARAAAAEAQAKGALGELEGERRRAQAEIAGLQEQLEQLRSRVAGQQSEIVTLAERAAAADARHRLELQRHQEIYREREESLEKQKAALELELRGKLEEMSTRFDALAGKALRQANDEFLKRAETLISGERQKAAAEMELKKAAVDQLIRPISETLEKTSLKLEQIDKARAESASMLGEHMRGLAEGNQQLRDETSRLARALRDPHVRGRYGEMQLRRVAELAGMQPYCDFAEQADVVDGEGNRSRPDMVVRLPSDRVVVVDAKTNIQGYLEALQARDPEEAEACLERFAGHVAEQAKALSRKKYWTHFEGSPEFVVMFIPGDQFIDAALARRPDLLEEAVRQNVILAGPAMLIGLLRAIEMGYREQRLARDAAELRELGAEFYRRACTAFCHFAKLGDSLETAVKRYNEFVGSYQNRLEPTMKRFAETSSAAGELPPVAPVDALPRMVSLFHPDLESAAPGELPPA
jgi:DNA recombination protein RmuC